MKNSKNPEKTVGRCIADAIEKVILDEIGTKVRLNVLNDLHPVLAIKCLLKMENPILDLEINEALSGDLDVEMESLCRAAYNSTRIRRFQELFNNFSKIVVHLRGKPVFILKNIYVGQEAENMKAIARGIGDNFNLSFLKKYFKDYEKFCWTTKKEDIQDFVLDLKPYIDAKNREIF